MSLKKKGRNDFFKDRFIELIDQWDQIKREQQTVALLDCPATLSDDCDCFSNCLRTGLYMNYVHTR